MAGQQLTTEECWRQWRERFPDDDPGPLEAGDHVTPLDGADVPSGTVIRLSTRTQNFMDGEQEPVVVIYPDLEWVVEELSRQTPYAPLTVPYQVHPRYLVKDVDAVMDKRNGERECGWCGQRFIPARPEARFCSGACRQAAYRDRRKGQA